MLHKPYGLVNIPTNSQLSYITILLLDYRRRKDNIKMDLDEIGLDVMSLLRIEIIGESMFTWHWTLLYRPWS